MVINKKKLIGIGIACFLGLGIVGMLLENEAVLTSDKKQLVSFANANTQSEAEKRRLVEEEINEAQEVAEKYRLAEEEKEAAQQANNNQNNPQSFENCMEFRKYYPSGVKRSHPAYASKLDGDNDGWACEKK